MKLGKVLKAYRNKYDVSIYVLADELKTTTSTLSRLENGKTIDIFTFNKIINWLLN